MRVKILLGLLVCASLVGVGMGMIWSNSLKEKSTLAYFFSDDYPAYIYYRANECELPKESLTFEGIDLNQVVLAALKTEKFKSVLLQKHKDQAYSIAFEPSRSFLDPDLDTIIAQLGISAKRKLLEMEDQSGKWTIKTIGSFFVFTVGDIELGNAQEFEKRFEERDKNASFAVIENGEMQEFYCFPNISKSFVKEKIDGVQIKSLGSNDLDFYHVLPSNIDYFEFLDKSLLFIFQKRWQESPLMEYTETGVIFGSLNNVNFYAVPIEQVFSPAEILNELIGDQEQTSAIKQVKGVVPNQRESYALVLEDVIILSSSSSVLESMSLSYQMQTGFNTTLDFDLMSANSSALVHHRWYKKSELFRRKRPLKVNQSVDFGYAYGRSRDNMVRFVSIASRTNDAGQSQSKPGLSAQVLWNFSLKNAQSSFHLNANGVVGVFNPNDLAFSVVDGAGKIAQTLTLTENLKSVKALSKGFLLETFEQLHWVPEQAGQGIKSYQFKGQIESSIAEYIWNGEEFITFISEQKLYKFSLKTGKSDALKIPVNLEGLLPQVHAFNHKGKLHIGYFNDANLHAVDVARNKWIKEPLNGKVVYSEKIEGTVHFVAKTNQGLMHELLFSRAQKNIPDGNLEFLSTTSIGTMNVWLFRNGGQFYLYMPTLMKGEIYDVGAVEISAVQPVFNGSNILGLLVLDDVSSQIQFFKKQEGTQVLKPSSKFRGAKFVKVLGPNKCLTSVDGQLVAYQF